MKISKAEFIKILKANADRFDRQDIAETDKLADLGVDSIGFVMTIYAIEEKLKVKIQDADLASLTPDSHVSDFVRVLAGLGIEIEL
ncbi:MAG TPA: acyl carrier protein [Candidatus Acidoferrum sp.]|nr:acyl carrier protein [Candidatus Acidoferrum sp.]